MRFNRSVLFLIWLCSGVSSGFCLSQPDMERLIAAGLDGQTIQTIIQEKTIETCRFSVQELVDLKTRAGLSNQTIQLLVQETSFLKNRNPVVYGQDVKPLHLAGIQDIIQLKQAGMGDEVIQALIVAGSQTRNRDEREKAWDMLKNLGIMIDTRQKDE